MCTLTDLLTLLLLTKQHSRVVECSVDVQELMALLCREQTVLLCMWTCTFPVIARDS